MEQNRDEIGTRRQESTQPPQTERKHPPEYERDLNPDRMEGQNIGTSEAGLMNAYDRKEMHRALRDFDDDELRSIPVLSEGQRLQQGATYLDLSNRERGEFTATGEMEAMEGHCIIPKDEVPYTLWNRLRGIDDPRRTT